MFKYINDFCNYFEITAEKFWETATNFINLDIWTQFDNTWLLQHPLYEREFKIYYE